MESWHWQEGSASLSLHPTKVPSFLCLRIDPGKGAKEELYPGEQGMPRHPDNPKAHSSRPDPAVPKQLSSSPRLLKAPACPTPNSLHPSLTPH